MNTCWTHKFSSVTKWQRKRIVNSGHTLHPPLICAVNWKQPATIDGNYILQVTTWPDHVTTHRWRQFEWWSRSFLVDWTRRTWRARRDVGRRGRTPARPGRRSHPPAVAESPLRRTATRHGTSERPAAPGPRRGRAPASWSRVPAWRCSVPAWTWVALNINIQQQLCRSVGGSPFKHTYVIARGVFLNNAVL